MARATKTLEERLRESASQANKFPTNGKADYWAIYRAFTGYLNQHVHPQVTMVAMLKDGGYLTDHGPDHIVTVIQRASDLLGNGIGDDFPLSPYEIFILLVAIHVHDAGHIKGGRRHHEANSGTFLDRLEVDAAEQRFIKDVAKVHGGVLSNQSKDTIPSIYVQRDFQGFEVRLQFLAAILRFADELSDDQTRGARYLLDNRTMPRSSEIYHAYARALPSVSIDLLGKEVRLTFQLSVEDVNRKFGKGTNKKDDNGNEIIEEIYLIDEILIRTFKMYCECIYCMRFFPTEFQLKSVNVRIDVVDQLEDVLDEPIGYKMMEQGYPTFIYNSAAGMCSKELTIDGAVINGASLREIVQKRMEELKS